MNKLPEGRKSLPDEWFIDRANNWGQIRPMTNDERKRAKEKEKANMNADEIDSVSLIAQRPQRHGVPIQAFRHPMVRHHWQPT